MVMVKVRDEEFYLDGKLKEKLDHVKYIINKKNFDCVFIIDGIERVGKSTLGITCGYYLSDGNFTNENICIDSDDAIKKIETLPDKSILLIDEGSLIFSGRDAMRKEQKKLIKIMNVVGQKNMIFIIVLPCFFDLNKQIAVRRSRFLLHCYADLNLNRGRFAYFGEGKKRVLYQIGKKNFDDYTKPSSEFVARYVDFNPLGKDYLEKKRKTLFAALHAEDKKDVKQIKADAKREIIFSIEEFEFPFKMTKKDKAKMVGVTPVTYYSYLRELKQAKMLGNQGKE